MKKIDINTNFLFYIYMDLNIPLTRTFSRRIYRNAPVIAAGEEHTCTLTSFNNSSFYLYH